MSMLRWARVVVGFPIRDLVDDTVESSALAPRNGFHLEPRCRICRNDQVRKKINDLLASGASYAMIVRALAATYAEGYPLTARRHADSRSLSVTLRGSVNAYRPDGLFGETLCNAHFRLVRTARPFSCVCNSRITVVLFLGQRLNVWSMCLIFGS